MRLSLRGTVNQGPEVRDLQVGDGDEQCRVLTIRCWAMKGEALRHAWPSVGVLSSMFPRHAVYFAWMGRVLGEGRSQVKNDG